MSLLRPASLLLLLALAGCGGSPVLEANVPMAPVVLDERAAAEAISRYRAQHGLGPVTIDSRLVRAASFQAGANARAGTLSHEGFNSRMASAGFGKGYASENLSAGTATFEGVLARWKASPDHNRNMLIPQIRRIGIASVDAPGSRYKRFWALMMAD